MNDTSQSFVKFEKIDKSYDGEVLVVKNLNLDIAKGEFVTMLGPSGSGKTTTLMMLAGFETPTNGEIFLDTKPISKIPPYEREIGMVFQNYALFPHMTVAENLDPIFISEDFYKGKPNPHAWISPKRGILYVDILVDSLSELRPSKRTSFEENGKIYKEAKTCRNSNFGG